MKKKKGLIWLSVLVVILIAGYMVAGYFLGNLPIASKILGTNKPRDLGVQVSVESAVQGLSALHKPTTTAELQAIANNPASYTVVNGSLTDAEASSLLALGNIPNFPLKLVQVKFGPNGSVQSSGVINVETLQLALKDMGASGEVVDRIMEIVKNAKWLNYYVEGTCSITNNQINANLDKLEIGRISLPLDWIEDNTGSMIDGVESALTSNGYNIRSMSISEDKVNLNMDRPLASIQPWLKFVETK